MHSVNINIFILNALSGFITLFLLMFYWTFCCHSLLELSAWQSQLRGTRGNTPNIFIRLSACSNNLLSELSDPIDDPIPPPLPLTLFLLLFQMAAKMGQLGVYLPTVLRNLPAGAVQPVSQAAGLANIEQQGVVPTVPTSSAPQTQELASSVPQLNTNKVPIGLERPAQEDATVQTPVQPKLQPTQRSPV